MGYRVSDHIGDRSKPLVSASYPLAVHTGFLGLLNGHCQYNFRSMMGSGSLDVFRHKQLKWNYTAYKIEQQIGASNYIKDGSDIPSGNYLKDLKAWSHTLFEWLYLYSSCPVQRILYDSPLEKYVIEAGLLD